MYVTEMGVMNRTTIMPKSVLSYLFDKAKYLSLEFFIWYNHDLYERLLLGF